jgi:hypothetical protein
MFEYISKRGVELVSLIETVNVAIKGVVFVFKGLEVRKMSLFPGQKIAEGNNVTLFP